MPTFNSQPEQKLQYKLNDICELSNTKQLLLRTNYKYPVPAMIFLSICKKPNRSKNNEFSLLQYFVSDAYLIKDLKACMLTSIACCRSEDASPCYTLIEEKDQNDERQDFSTQEQAIIGILQSLLQRNIFLMSATPFTCFTAEH